jgi:hypothetical protein
VLYFLANQTQIGWVYVIGAGLIGLLVLASFYNWGMLKSVRATRSLRNLLADSGRSDSALANQGKDHEHLAGSDFVLPNFHEDDTLEVRLHFRLRGLRPALPVHGIEHCPFAPTAAQEQTFFSRACSKTGRFHSAIRLKRNAGDYSPFQIFLCTL